MASRIRRPSKLKRRSAAAKALGDRLFRQRVVAGKSRRAKERAAIDELQDHEWIDDLGRKRGGVYIDD